MNLTDRIMLLITADTGGAVGPLGHLEKQSKQTESSFDKLGRQVGITGQTLKAGLVAGAAAFVSTQLVQFLNDSVQAFGDSAKAAGELAHATGGTVEEVSRMTAALTDAGVSSEKSAALLTKFTTNAGRSADQLDELGVSLVRNKDGTVDYAASMVKVVDAIGKVGDASERNKLLVQFFGKQGASAFQELYASGIKLSDAMAAISKYRVFSTDDVRRAVAYDDAMDSLGAAVQGLQFSLGRALIPALSAAAGALSTILDVINPVVSVLGAMPSSVYLVAGAAAFLARTITVELVQGAFVKLGAAVIITGTGLTSLTTITLVAKGAFQALTAAIVANPIGAALVVLTGAYAAFSFASSKMKDSANEALPRLAELEKQGKSSADALHQTAAELEKNSGFWSNLGAAIRGSNWSTMFSGEDVSDTRIRGYTEQLEEARKKMGEFAFQSGVSADAQKTLNDLLAEGSTDTEALAAAARTAAEGESETNRIREESARLIAEQSGQLDKLIHLRLDEAGLLAGAETAYGQVEQAARDLAKAQDLASTQVDESKVAIEGLASAIDSWAGKELKAGTPVDQVIAKLEALKKISPETAATIDIAIQGIKDKDVKVKAKADGVDATNKDIDKTEKDRTAIVTVESRGGPAVVEYLTNRVAGRDYLALVHVESRNGPAVVSYIDNQIARDYQATVWVTLKNRQTGQTYASIPQQRSAGSMIAATGVGTLAAPTVTAAPTVNVAVSTLTADAAMVRQLEPTFRRVLAEIDRRNGRRP